MTFHSAVRCCILLPMLASLASCGGGGGGGGNGGGGTTPPITYQPGVFPPSGNFAGRCVTPRSGTSDRAGSRTEENHWLRSWTNELYLWYSEVPDLNPASYSTLAYFDLLKTSATTPSGADKDQFHFTYDTEVWEELSQGGIEAGYGAEFALLAVTPPRKAIVAFTEPGTTGASQLARGDEILTVDGADFVNGNTQAIVDTLNAGMFPSGAGQSHTFTVRNLAGVTRTVTMTTAAITKTPVPIVTTFNTTAGVVGYLQFNDHIATAESQLVTAINTLDSQNVVDLILDVRYNGGGYLDIASELAYMIGDRTLTSGETFERIEFNDKYPNTNPVTGQALTPTPFYGVTRGFGTLPAGTALPSLDLARVFVITGPGTCSASESIINGLRGVGVQVIQIGSQTCGKPYGFYAFDNCGTTYFSIQFRGENAAGFGDYADGFSPNNQPAPRGEVLPGCSVHDDFNNPLGNAAEARIAAALSYAAGNACPGATGFKPRPLVAKQTIAVDGFDGAVRKPLWREMRILTD